MRPAHFIPFAWAIDPGAYADASACFDDLAAVYRGELAELTQVGCRYLHEVPVAMLCDPDARLGIV